MFEVLRAGRVLGKLLGRRTVEDTKRVAAERFGRGVSLRRVL